MDDPFSFNVGQAPAFVPTPQSTIRSGPTGTPILPTSVTPIQGDSEDPVASPIAEGESPPAPPQSALDLISVEASRAVDLTFPSYASTEAHSYGDEENPFLEGSPSLASVPDAKPSDVPALIASTGDILLGAAIPYDSQDEDEEEAQGPIELAGDAISGTWWTWETVATREWQASKGEISFRTGGTLLTTWDAKGSWQCQGDGEYRLSFADQDYLVKLTGDPAASAQISSFKCRAVGGRADGVIQPPGQHLWTPRAAADVAPGFVHVVEEEVGTPVPTADNGGKDKDKEGDSSALPRRPVWLVFSRLGLDIYRDRDTDKAAASRARSGSSLGGGHPACWFAPGTREREHVSYPSIKLWETAKSRHFNPILTPS